MNRRSTTSSERESELDARSRGGVSRGFAAGLAPLGPTALIVALAVALAELARRFTAGQGFGAQQTAAIVVVIAGLLGGTTAFVVYCVRALRRVKGWQQAGQTAQAGAALWGLAVVALVALLPLLLAIVIPQHPAPNLAP